MACLLSFMPFKSEIVTISSSVALKVREFIQRRSGRWQVSHLTCRYQTALLSYLQVWRRISCSAEEAGDLQDPVKCIALKHKWRMSRVFPRRDKWRESSDGILVEEDQGSVREQNALVQLHHRQRSAGRRRHRPPRGQTQFSLRNYPLDWRVMNPFPASRCCCCCFYAL